MVTIEQIESYMLQMELPYEELGEGIWVIYDSDNKDAPKLIVSFSEEVVHFRIKVMEIPKNQNVHCELFRKLLEFSATGLTHGAFAIENNSIVLLDSLQAENLDFNEFQASIEALFFGIMDAYDELSKYMDKQAVCK